MSAPYNVNNLLQKPVYDISSYGEDLQLPFGTKNLDLQAITWSELDELFVYKFNITLCVALSITAYTSGNHSVDDVNVIIKETLGDGTLVRTIANLTQATGMTNTQAVEDKACIMTFEGNIPFKVAQGNKVTVQIILGRTDTNTATTFEGIMPLFYFQKSSLAKTMIESTLGLHLHPALDHAFPVFRDQSIQDALDYDGVTKEGFDRSHSA